MKEIEDRLCEHCGCKILVQYGSGRFCSSRCARSFSASIHRQETNKKISKSMKKFFQSLSDEERRKYIQKISKRLVKGKQNKAKESYVKIRNSETKKNDILNITKGELEQYRKNHQVCEICGRGEIISTSKYKEKNNLCIDHNHKTKEFRGLLCFRCNRDLGWFEKYRAEISSYLKES